MERFHRALLPLIVALTTLLHLPCKGCASEPVDSLQNVLSACGEDTVCMRLHLELCDILVFQQPNEAAIYCNEALEFAEGVNDTLALARTHNLLGIIATLKSHYITGVESFQQAMRYYEAANDQEGVSKLLNNIGVIYSSLENYEESIRYFKECYELNINRHDIEGASFNLFNIANDYLSLEDFEASALYIDSLSALHASYKEAISPVPMRGELHLAQKEYNAAEPYLLESLEIHRSQGEEHHLSSGFLSLAELYLGKQRFALANAYLDSAEQVSIKNELNENLLAGFNLRARIYNQQGKFKQAYNQQEAYVTLKDSLDEINNFNRISELNARFESEKREKELAEKEAMIVAQQANEKLQTRVFFIVITAIIIVLSIVSWSLIRKRRTNKLLNIKNEEIEAQRQKIIASIHYAKKIQSAILLPEAEIKQHLNDSFIYFRPKDIVSGDFYWFSKVGDEILIATIDCTGHGVPGAFMSLIANSKLNKVVNELGCTDPGEILNKVHEEILTSLNQHNGYSRSQDGMDMSLCKLNRQKGILQFAGARNPALIVNRDSITELKPDNLSIGGAFFHLKHASSEGFRTQELQVTPDSYLYLFTDGYVDQFGGENNKKLNKKRFQELLLEVSTHGFGSVKERLDQRLNDWRGKNPQIDDILIIGAKL